MFKKFNYNLNRSPVGAIWGICFTMFLCGIIVSMMHGEFIMDKRNLIIIFLGYGLAFNFAIATYILFTGEIKQVNIIQVCPTARQNMSEQEIAKIETHI